MVVGIDEEVEVSAQLLVIVIVVAFDSGFLDCAVHALDLSIRPRVVGLCQAMLDLIGVADHVEAAEARDHGVPVSRLFGELDAVIGQDDVYLVGNGFQDSLEKGHRRGSVCLFIRADNGEF